MQRRSAGKRIRMDDPPPPDIQNIMSPNDGEAHFSDRSASDQHNDSSYDGHNETLQPNDFSNNVAFSSDESSIQPRPRRSKRTAAAALGNETPPAKTTRRGRPPAAAAAIVEQPGSPEETDKPKRKPRAKKTPVGAAAVQNVEAPMDDDDSLYAAVFNAKSSLQTLVDDWIDAYKVNRDETLLQLMQFFISSSGCKGKITSEMQNSMEHVAIIRKMTEEFDEESGEYPLVMSGIPHKKFKSNFCDFVQTLVKQCQYSIIYDQYLMDNVISLLTGLSDSQVRAFRHTATLAAMKLMTALVDVALTVSVNLDNTQRQYEAERQKTSNKRATDRLETLMLKRQELEENMDEIKNVLTYMFKSVFVHRYRDTLPEIRAICMSEIGIWMKKFSSNFLDDSYLKYIGWTLHDKVGEVRLKCLQALQPLYSSEELKGKLELFTSKFKDRIVAMTLDKEYDVAVQAVKLVISIHKYHREILSDKDCELVYELVYSSHRAVAQAAGEFLNERLFVIDEGAVDNVRSHRGKQRVPNTPLIRDLVQFFIESELHEHGAYLVDSLIDSNSMMKDWECMTDLLLEDPGDQEEQLDDKQETSLIEIMICAVKQCATGEPPIGRGPTRKVLSAKELKSVSDDKSRLTEHFIPTLPLLLKKFKNDPDKVSNLLSLPQYFDLEVYTTSRQERCLDQLLKLIGEITEMHTDVDVLEVAAKSLEIMCCDDARKSSRTEVALIGVLENIWKKAKQAIDTYNESTENDGEANEDELYDISMSLRKISIFSGCHTFSKWDDVWNKLFEMIKETNEHTKTYPEEAVNGAIAACYFSLLWDLKEIQENGEGGGSGGTKMVKKLAERTSTYMQAMKDLLANSQEFKAEAYTSICDGLVVFCDQLATSDYLQPLVYHHSEDPDLQVELNAFMQDHVFSESSEEDMDEHARIEQLHKKRNYLAQFCKLIVYNIIPTKAAADVFKHYVKYYNDYGDIIKATLGKAREINKVNCALTMLTSLRNVFMLLPRTEDMMVDRQSEDFIALKDLAKRFALSFGLDAVKNRDAITGLHREGILTAVTPLENSSNPTLPPPNLDFLEILAEFTNKLLKQDKKVVQQYLDHRVASATPSSQGSHWQPLHTYKNSLMHGESEVVSTTAKRAYTRKRNQAADEDAVDEEDYGDD